MNHVLPPRFSLALLVLLNAGYTVAAVWIFRSGLRNELAVLTAYPDERPVFR